MLAGRRSRNQACPKSRPSNPREAARSTQPSRVIRPSTRSMKKVAGIQLRRMGTPSLNKCEESWDKRPTEMMRGLNPGGPVRAPSASKL